MLLAPVDVDPERDVVVSIAEGRLFEEMSLLMSDNLYGDEAGKHLPHLLGEEERNLQKFLLEGNKQWSMLDSPACYEIKNDSYSLTLCFAPCEAFYEDIVMFISSSRRTIVYPLVLHYGQTVAFATYIYSSSLKMGILNLIAGLRFSKEVLERELLAKLLAQRHFSFDLRFHFDSLVDLFTHRSGKKELSFSVGVYIYNIKFPLARGTISVLNVETYKNVLCCHYLESSFIRKFHKANTIDEMVEAVEKYYLRLVSRLSKKDIKVI